MTKILAAFGLYWHVILDLILTHLYVIAFLFAGYPAIAAFLMAVDALFKATLMVFLSRHIVPLSANTRGKLSVLFRFSLVGTWLLATIQLPFFKISLLTFSPFILFKLISTIDTSMSMNFIFSLQKKFNISISQSAAAMNILVRSGTAIAPAIALMLIRDPKIVWMIFGLVLTIGIFSTLLLRNVFFTSKAPSSIKPKHLSFTTLIKNPLMRWGLNLQFLVNLGFSGVAFLLLAQLKLHSDVILNEITILYGTFFLVQVFVLVGGDKIILATKPVHITIMILTCAFAVFAAGMSSGVIRLLICGLIGLTYSLIISASQKIITARLQGDGFLEFTSWAQIIGRYTSFISTTALGIIMSHSHITSANLLALCGLIGLSSAIILGYSAPSRNIRKA